MGFRDTYMACNLLAGELFGLLKPLAPWSSPSPGPGTSEVLSGREGQMLTGSVPLLHALGLGTENSWFVCSFVVSYLPPTEAASSLLLTL